MAIFVAFSLGLVVGWVSMVIFICLTGNMRTREEQSAYLAEQRVIKAGQRAAPK